MKLSILSIAAATLVIQSTNAQQPNILIILADDLGYEALGAYGGLDYSTPEVDAMAAQGIRFDRAYTSPVCTPTRVSLHTGLYVSDHGHSRVLPVHNGTSDYVDFISMPTFAQQLRAEGYRTSVTGKWQLATYTENPNHLSESGFDSWCIWQIWDGSAKTTRYWNPYFNEDGVVRNDITSAYGPDVLADYVTEQMTEARDAGEPFLILHNMLLPHEEDGLFIQTPDDIAAGRPASLSNMINYMDKIVGRLLDDIETLGLRENTYVFFMGDNGTDTNDIRNTVDGPVSGGKRDLDDGGTHIPFIVWGPSGIGSNRAVEDLVDITDVFPTVCSLAGVQIPASIPYRGRSLVPQLEGRLGIHRRYVHQGIYDIFDNKEREAVFDGEWRLQLDNTLMDGRNPNNETIVSLGNSEGDTARSRLQYALDYIRNGASVSSGFVAEDFFNGYGSATINVDGLKGGTGWTSSWGDGDSANDDANYVSGTSLSWTVTGYDDSGNLGGSGNGALVYSDEVDSSIVPREFSSSATTLWFSALISIDEVDDRVVLWIDSTQSNVNSGDFVGVLDGSIQMRYNGSNDLTTAGAPSIGTHLLLAKAEINISGSNDRLSFWFNPDLSAGEGGLSTPTYMQQSEDTFGSKIEGVAVLLRDNASLATGGERIDSIRIGTTFDAVVSSSTPDNLDIWRRMQFGPDAFDDLAEEAALWGDFSDPDEDGTFNIFEYYRGTDPQKPDTIGPRYEWVQMSSGLHLRQVERLNDTRAYLQQEVSSDLTFSSLSDPSAVLVEESRILLNAEFDEVIYSIDPEATFPAFVRDGVVIP